MAGVPRAPSGEDNEDWLLGYLATTDAGKDPKLNLATQKVQKPKKGKDKPKTGAPGTKTAGGVMSSAAGHVTSILGIKRGMARRSSWAAPLSAQADIKLAAQAIQAQNASTVPPQAAPSAPQAVAPAPPQPVQLAPPTADVHMKDSAEPVDAQLAGQHASTKLAFLQAGNIYHKSTLDAAAAAKQAAHDDMTSPSDNFHKWAMSAQPPPTSRRMSSSGGGLRPQNRGTAAPTAAGAPSKRRMSTSRISMSGRRQSMDYSELDAVKQRLNHAATLWAVADDEDEEGTTDEEDSEEEEAPPPLPVTAPVPVAPPVAEVPVPAAAQKKGLFKMFSKGK